MTNGEHMLSYFIHKPLLDSPVGIQLSNAGNDRRVHVSMVMAGGAAAKAGVSVGDVVHTINGTECSASPSVGAALLRSAPPGFVEIVVSSMTKAIPTHHRTPTKTFDNEVDLLDAPDYSEQIASLSTMGFADAERSLSALKLTNGNLERAIEKLLESAGSGSGDSRI